jgi:hypothetical protein
MTVAARHATLEDTSPGGVPPRVRARRWWRQHTRWINRLSTAKYAALVVVIGAATGPAIGVCFEDQLRPPLDPYLSPLRTYLGIAPVDKPLLVPYVPIDQFPDPPGDPVAMTPPAALPPVPVAPRAAARRAAPAPAAPVAAPRQARAGARQAVVPAGSPIAAGTTATTPQAAPPPTTTSTTTKEPTNEPTTTPHPTPPPRTEPDPATPSTTRPAGPGGSSSPTSSRTSDPATATDPATTADTTTDAGGDVQSVQPSAGSATTAPEKH